jgi:hypothetical protein
MKFSVQVDYITKVKLSLCLTNYHYIMNVYVGVDI